MAVDEQPDTMHIHGIGEADELIHLFETQQR